MSIEQLAIESTYYHSSVIMRHGEYEDDHGETKSGLQIIYLDVDCAVSQNSGLNVTQTSPRNLVEYSTKLFCNPSYVIKTGDIVTTTFENGLVRNYKAGESIPYPYHQEVPLIREDEA